MCSGYSGCLPACPGSPQPSEPVACYDGALRTFLVVQWLGLCSSTAGDPGLLSGQETKILQAVRCGKKIKIKYSGTLLGTVLLISVSLTSPET